MGRARPGVYVRLEPVERLQSLGGDPLFFKNLTSHPALKAIERLDDEERRKAELVERIAELGKTLSLANEQITEIGWDIVREKTLARHANAWITRLKEAMRNTDHVRLGLSAEQYAQGNEKRRGLYASHHERYFFVAFLVPYTALLRQEKGKTPVPDWELIEAWLRKISRLGDEVDLRLRSWWGKEVLQRKSRPSQPLLYALTAGAALYLESPTGRRAKWIVEHDHLGRPLSSEENLRPVKRSINAQDRAYLRLAFKYVPLARASFLNLYPQAKDLIAGLPPSPIEALAKKRTDEVIEKLPTRSRLRLANIRGEKLNTKVLFKAAKATIAKADKESRQEASKSAGASGGRSRGAR